MCGQLHTPGKTLGVFTKIVKGFDSDLHIYHIQCISLKSSTYKRGASKTSLLMKKCMARRMTETSQGFESMCSICEEIQEKSFHPLHFNVLVGLPLCHHWLLSLINEYDNHSVSINWLYDPRRTFASFGINFQASLSLPSLLQPLKPIFSHHFQHLQHNWLSNVTFSFSDILKHFLHSSFFLWRPVTWKILKNSVRKGLSLLFQVLHTKASGFIQNGALFYVMFYSAFISSRITGTIKSTEKSLLGHRKRENCSPF
jgi:hypothetical protein